MKDTDNFPELSRASVLLVDDDQTTSGLIVDMLAPCVERIVTVHSCSDAYTASREGIFNIALIDINLPDGNGFDIINQVRQEELPIKCIMITGFVDAVTAHRLEHSNIQTLLTKPFSPTQLKFSICRELARKNRQDRGITRTDREGFSGNELVGVSAYTRELRRKIADFAPCDMPVLIMGPTGTGKEIIARAIHRGSGRGEKSLITVNSSAIPDHLEESEFFGHTKGAFTGASQSKEGILRCADGSSLFLDEVGELSLRMQAKLLRVLDGHEFLRVGDTVPQKVDFRLISATNRPLADMIKCGTFREDLYFRLRAACIITAPLSKHKEDIPSLVNHFLRRVQADTNRNFEMSVEALEVIIHYTWPGNIRELKNVVESLCAITMETDVISKERVLWVLSESLKGDTAPVVPFSSAKIDFERDYYRTLLIKCNGNISMASRAAGIERAYFSKRIRALGLAKDKFTAKKEGEEEAVL
jgi:DNA-binding NtrC family response regulator